MTQEEKMLLLQDLCARLPYKVKCSTPYGIGVLDSIDMEHMDLTFEGPDDNYYTLQGIRVKNPSKGVYIKNGKKVIVK